MFDLSPDKILVLGVLALVVLGPNRLPEAARSAGRVLGQLRRMSSSFQAEVRDALGEPGEVLSNVVTELRPPDVRRSVRQAISQTLGPDPAPTAAAGMVVPQAPDDPSLN